MNRNVIVSNLFWRFMERIGAQLVSFIVSIILARKLSPDVYGTVAIVNIFIAILQVFVDGGLANSLIQKKNADDIDFSTVFIFNLFFSLLIYFCFYNVAPYIARFYGDCDLVIYMRILGLVIIVGAIKNVEQAYVAKNLLFRKFFKSTIIGTIAAGLIGVFLAFNGFGIWALIFQHLINVCIDTIILFFTVHWKPKLLFSLSRLKKLYSYGWKLLFSNLLETIYSNLRQLIIGKFYSSADLAYYNRGEQFPNLIVYNINQSIDSVLLPVMANSQDDKNIVRKMMRKSIIVSSFLISPLMIGLAVTSDTLVKLLLNDSWLPCVPFLRLFCLAYLLLPIHTSNLNAIKAIGRSDIFLKLEVLKKILGLILLFLSIRINVEAIAITYLLTSFISLIINSFPNKQFMNYGFSQQVLDCVPSFFGAFLMGLVVFPLRFVLAHNWILFFAQVGLGVIVYVSYSILFNSNAYKYIKSLILSIGKK